MYYVRDIEENDRWHPIAEEGVYTLIERTDTTVTLKGDSGQGYVAAALWGDMKQLDAGNTLIIHISNFLEK